jgi:schlafen family protein
MWVPRTAREVEDAARSGALAETSRFDAKAALPQPKKNAEVAKDIAAMATDGGVLLYGVAEDEHGQPTVSQPITLDGAADRVGQIVATSIAEVPFTELHPLPSDDDPAKGYLVVVVPQSARAPHMVIVNGDNRFYGRSATGNRILSEGEVARLYERRTRWEVNREALLEEVVSHAPVRGRADRGYVHAYTRPVALDRTILERAQEKMGEHSGGMLQWLLNVVHSTVLQNQYGPSLEGSAYLRRHGGDMWRWATLSADEIALVAAQADQTTFDPSDLVTIDLNLDGRGQLFCGRATDALLKSTDPILIEVVIAGNIEAFLAVMGALYAAAGYHGAVDVGLAITGVRGARSERQRRNFGGPPYPVDGYTRTLRVAAGELEDPADVGQRLLGHFFEATTGIDGYNPWTQPRNR